MEPVVNYLEKERRGKLLGSHPIWVGANSALNLISFHATKNESRNVTIYLNRRLRGDPMK
jgi:hypothetical protein